MSNSELFKEKLYQRLLKSANKKKKQNLIFSDLIRGKNNKTSKKLSEAIKELEAEGKISINSKMIDSRFELELEVVSV